MDAKSLCHPRVRTNFQATTAAACVLFALGGGCHRPWYVQDESPEQLSTVSSATAPRRSASALQSAAATSAKPNGQANASTLADPFDLAAQRTHELALAEIAGELRDLDEIDPAARAQFLADLQEVNPDHWPQMVRTFRSTLAYRREHGTPSNVDGEAGDDLAIAFGSDSTATPEERLAVAPTADDVKPLPTPLPEPAVVESASDIRSHELPMRETLPPERQDRDAGVVNAVFNTQDGPNPPQDYGGQPRNEPNAPADIETLPALLNRAIAKWESELTAAPATSAEIAEHARLRLLHVTAGDYEAALRPISGVPPSHQDYWAKLLFALSTYLDEDSQPDVRRRASLARHHLDAATDLLGEIAMLEVRNLAFCSDIRGFGIYEPIEQPEFRAGEQVKLYAEVANYRSEPSEDGFQTLLATSYEILDASDQRVDSGEFPQVEDVCRARRQDFHIQYGVDLPSRIYPGTYRLQLTIEDMLSRKLGRASVEFEIAADAAAKR